MGMSIKWGPIGKDVYDRTYSRRKADGTKETWPETIERVVSGNLELVDKKFWIRNEKQRLIDLFLNFKALPAGRHLWVSGVKGRQFLFNCHSAGWRDKLSDHYTFTFDELMKGGGVGSNYSDRYINKYPYARGHTKLHIVCDSSHPDYEDVLNEDGTIDRPGVKHMCSDEYHHEWDGCIPIEDSREGWVDGLTRVVDEAHKRPSIIVLDVSRIRAYGTLIRSFGGKASGPGALIKMLHGVNDLLNNKIGHKLSSIDHMEIDHMIAQCVVAGNVRRSARMSIKYWKDPAIFDFINCKTDKARTKHWTTNISVEIDDKFFRAFKKKDPHAVKVYKSCVDAMYKSGEPGFWNSSLSQHGEIEPIFSTNPCGEIALLPFENCNLGHVNLGEFAGDPDGAKVAFRLMARFLIRATFGDIGSEWQKEVVSKNRRIGVGFFGFQDWLCKQGKKYSECHHDRDVRSLLRSFYLVVKEEATKYSHQLRIPSPIKFTTLAPTGTISKLVGTSEGGQNIYSPFFHQRVRFEKNNPILKRLKAEGHYIEPDVVSENTMVVSYYCKHPLVDKIESMSLDSDELVEGQDQVSLHDTFAIQAMLQEEWADNAISLTANITSDTSKKELFHTLIKFLPRLKGTTVLVGAGDRPQPPYTRITREEYDSYNGKKELGQGIRPCKGNVCPIK